MQVKLLTSPANIAEQLHNAALAALTCTGNEANLNKSDYDKLALLEKIAKSGHGSILEHINLTFRIEDISRALLQELARHRHISLSVQSTRRTLKKISEPSSFDKACDIAIKHTSNLSENARHELMSNLGALLESIEDMGLAGVLAPDDAKYFLPECYPTSLVMTCNVRELRHIFYLRENPPALYEFNNLCVAIKKTLPPDIVRLLKAKEVTS